MPDPVNLIRSGKTRLAARRSARIAVTNRFTYHDEVDESHFTGIIDFEQGRYRTSGDNEEHIGIGAMGFTRAEGDERWIVKGDDPAAAPTPGDVPWMLDLLAGVIEAEELASPRPDRASYACVIDLVKADEHSAAGVASPGGYTVRQLQQLEFRVDLDHESTVRAINWSLPDGTGATLEFVELEVAVPPIEPPPEEQQVQFWDLLEDEEE